jgi:hypothetical protein
MMHMQDSSIIASSKRLEENLNGINQQSRNYIKDIIKQKVVKLQLFLIVIYS